MRNETAPLLLRMHSPAKSPYSSCVSVIQIRYNWQSECLDQRALGLSNRGRNVQRVCSGHLLQEYNSIDYNKLGSMRSIRSPKKEI